MPSAQEELHSIAQILHLTHHRNKNQHRLAKWWKAFSMLRRNISKLLTELEINIQYTALSAKAKKTIESREIVDKRVAFLEDHLVPKAYLAFSQLVADNQYAALGLMLIGTLARSRTAIQPLRGEEMDEEMTPDRSIEGLEVKEVHDFGEVVKREEIRDSETKNDQKPDGKDSDDAGEDAAALKVPKTKKRSVPPKKLKERRVEDSTSKTRPKKKRKKGDAFDDLFAGLV